MKVIYSLRANFAGSGIGNTAYNAVAGIYRHHHLKKLLTSSYQPSEIDGHLIKTIPVDKFDHIRGMRRIYPPYIEDNLYDLIASLFIDQCDIFHGWNHHCLFSLRKAKKLGVITIVERASSHPLTQNRLLIEEYQRWGIKKHPTHPWVLKKCLQEIEEADYITSPSDFAYQSLIENGVSETKIIKIPFGAKPISKKQKNKKTKKQIITINNQQSTIENQNSETKFIALFVGEVGFRKGVPYLLEAWKKLNLPDAELWLAGGVAPEFRSLLNQYRDISSIKLLGFVSPINEVYQKASVFVFPSIEEGSALVTYEAMSYGLPQIVTFNSGSVVEDGEEGFIVPIRDPDAIAERIKTLYHFPEIWERMSKRALTKARIYTWHNYGENLVKEYQKIMRA